MFNWRKRIGPRQRIQTSPYSPAELLLIDDDLNQIEVMRGQLIRTLPEWAQEGVLRFRREMQQIEEEMPDLLTTVTHRHAVPWIMTQSATSQYAQSMGIDMEGGNAVASYGPYGVLEEERGIVKPIVFNVKEYLQHPSEFNSMAHELAHGLDDSAIDSNDVKAERHSDTNLFTLCFMLDYLFEENGLARSIHEKVSKGTYQYDDYFEEYFSNAISNVVTRNYENENSFLVRYVREVVQSDLYYHEALWTEPDNPVLKAFEVEIRDYNIDNIFSAAGNPLGGELTGAIAMQGWLMQDDYVQKVAPDTPPHPEAGNIRERLEQLKERIRPRLNVIDATLDTFMKDDILQDAYAFVQDYRNFDKPSPPAPPSRPFGM